MKLSELKVDRLKRELSKLELPIGGSKSELQKRLTEDLQQRGINIDNYEFDDEEEPEVCISGAVSIDINSLLEKLQAQNKLLLAEAREAWRADVRETSRAERQILLAEIQEIKENTRAINEKLTEIYETESKRVNGVEARVPNLEKGVEDKLNICEEESNKLATTVKRMSCNAEKVDNLQCQPELDVCEGSGRIKTPCLHGRTPLAVCKFQFDSVASRTGCCDEEKALELSSVSKGTAAEILKAMPPSSRNNYNDVMMAPQHKACELLYTEVERNVAVADNEDYRDDASKTENNKVHEEAKHAEAQERRNNLQKVVHIRMEVIGKKMKAGCDWVADIEYLRVIKMFSPCIQQREKRLTARLLINRGRTCKVNKRLNKVDYRDQDHYDPRTKMKSAWQTLGVSVMSLFGTNRLKWEAMLRRSSLGTAVVVTSIK